MCAVGLQHIFAGLKRTRDQKSTCSFVLYRTWIPGERRRGICAVECVAAHLRGCKFHWVTSAVCTCWSAMRTHSCILSSTVPSLLSPALDRRGTFVECITAVAVLQHGPTADTCDGVENQMLVQIDLLRYWKECTHLLECLSGQLKLAITGFMLLVLMTTHPFHPDRHER